MAGTCAPDARTAAGSPCTSWPRAGSRVAPDRCAGHSSRRCHRCHAPRTGWHAPRTRAWPEAAGSTPTSSRARTRRRQLRRRTVPPCCADPSEDPQCLRGVPLAFLVILKCPGLVAQSRLSSQRFSLLHDTRGAGRCENIPQFDEPVKYARDRDQQSCSAHHMPHWRTAGRLPSLPTRGTMRFRLCTVCAPGYRCALPQKKENRG